MFIVPECDTNTQETTIWVNHSVNDYFILQSRRVPRERSFLKKIGLNTTQSNGQPPLNLQGESENSPIINVENCLYRILTKSHDQKRIYVIAIDNEFRNIINNWNSACEEIIPVVRCTQLFFCFLKAILMPFSYVLPCLMCMSCPV